MKHVHIFILITILLALIPIASAENITSYRTVTMKGPNGLLVELGIENVLPLSEALQIYNWISAIIIILVGSLAAKRDTRFVAILIPIFAAILLWFGWLNTPDPGKTISIVIMCAVLAVAIYMKDSLHEGFGIAGPGSMLMNLAIFLIILQAVVGMLNAGAIFDQNIGVQSDQYQNVDLSQEVTSISNTSGLLGDILTYAMILVQLAIATIKILLSIILSVGIFSIALVMIFPFLTQSPMALALLGVMQIGIWILYAKFFSDLFYMKAFTTTEF